ncbi:hypothetical protein DH2020_017399 [Rehmannia glutinosa]|uniref:4-hydroxy-tetrahydrodipicolinate reductase n=1 Tax=Rehmannia glutinosa TaxID=99300 RepID=A0ABR0WRV9_REHGL
MASTPAQSLELAPTSKNVGIPIMVNGCTGKMGRAVLEAAMSAGLNPVPVALGGPEDSGKILDFNGKQVEVHGPSDRESILSSVFNDYPNMIVVDYTVPTAVNDNAALYCKVGVPFVMGTTGGDRELLYKTVADSKVYAVISPQMGKQVVAFLAAMEIMAEQFPGAFSGYDLQVMESHQAGKLDISGTAKAVISCFQKLGASFELEQVIEFPGSSISLDMLCRLIGFWKHFYWNDVLSQVIPVFCYLFLIEFHQVKLIRDPRLQVEMVGVPEEHLSGHAFHISIYAEGTVDAILFLAKKVSSNADKRIYDMIDVLREANFDWCLMDDGIGTETIKERSYAFSSNENRHDGCGLGSF